MPKTRRHHKSFISLIFKLVAFLICLLLAYLWANSHYPELLIDKILPYKIIAAFFLGGMYTSVFTTPFAVIGLFVLGQRVDPLTVTLFGALGAMLVDLMIVIVLRHIFKAADKEFHHFHFFHNLGNHFRGLHLDVLAVVLGIIIIASPFPDEAGLAMMGATKMKYSTLLFLTFLANALGIGTIASTAYVLR